MSAIMRVAGATLLTLWAIVACAALFGEHEVDSDTMPCPYIECPSCGAKIRARMPDVSP